MASSHYARILCDYLYEHKIDYVTKRRNAPAVPNQRPIERFWASCKSKYKQLNEKCGTVRKFKNRWMKISKKYRRKVVLISLNILTVICTIVVIKACSFILI